MFHRYPTLNDVHFGIGFGVGYTTTKEDTMTDADTVENDPVNSPAHYRHPSGIECIAVTRLCHGDMSAAIQYIWRHADKGNPEQDLRKAAWYLRDTLDNALPSSPPHKAKVLLRTAVGADDNPVRAELLGLIADGRLDWCVNRIADITGDQH